MIDDNVLNKAQFYVAENGEEKVKFELEKDCGAYIVMINETLAELSDKEKKLKKLKELACNFLLDRLNVSGQKNYNFTGIGTFAVRRTTQVSFPTEDNGGKQAAVNWLISAVKAGVITEDLLLSVQQSRLNKDVVLYIEQLVDEYNEDKPDSEKLPRSPFTHYDKEDLSTPRKLKQEN